jgi:hypothetical protein
MIYKALWLLPSTFMIMLGAIAGGIQTAAAIAIDLVDEYFVFVYGELEEEEEPEE